MVVGRSRTVWSGMSGLPHMGHTCPARTAGCVAPQYGQEGMSLIRAFAPCRAPPAGSGTAHAGHLDATWARPIRGMLSQTLLRTQGGRRQVAPRDMTIPAKSRPIAPFASRRTAERPVPTQPVRPADSDA